MSDKKPKATIWVHKVMDHDADADAMRAGNCWHYKVIKTQNTLHPSINDCLKPAVVQGLIDHGMIVNIS